MTLEPKEAILVMDFSENYLCVFQNESQSAYFEQVQVTIHPMMMYYSLSKESPDGKLATIDVKHALIGISDDLKHDFLAVKAFEDAAIHHLQQSTSGGIDTIYEFTDGCAAQYKGRGGFATLSQRPEESQLICRNFFETSHGKNVCDGLGATVKSSSHQAVISGKKIIANAKDLFKHCQEILEHGRGPYR